MLIVLCVDYRFYKSFVALATHKGFLQGNSLHTFLPLFTVLTEQWRESVINLFISMHITGSEKLLIPVSRNIFVVVVIA